MDDDGFATVGFIDKPLLRAQGPRGFNSVRYDVLRNFPAQAPSGQKHTSINVNHSIQIRINTSISLFEVLDSALKSVAIFQSCSPA